MIVKTTAEQRKKLVRALTAPLEDGGCLARGDILDAAMTVCGFDPSAQDIGGARDPEYNTVRSYLGAMLTELVRTGDILRCGNGYRLVEQELVAVEKQDCREALLSIVRAAGDAPGGSAGQSGLTKSELYAALGRHFGTDRTYSLADDNALKGMAGQLLSGLVADGTLSLRGGRYRLRDAVDPAVYRRVYDDVDELCRLYIDRLHEKGGRFFETFSAGLLEKYFTLTGRRVLSCDVMGGSEDGGVDVELSTRDDLGFEELVMVQAKCRVNMQVTERNIREFFGAMTARGGTRGIYMTLGSFHASAQRLLASIPNCVGIDGDRVFHLALITGYGLERVEGGYAFDEMVFA